MDGLMRGLRAASLLIVLAGCATSPNPFKGTPERPLDLQVLDREVLASFTNAQRAVETLRSNWMKRRVITGLYTSGTVWVYRDGMKVGGPEVLGYMSTIDISSIQYYRGIEASSRWGLGHENGVILVTSLN